MSKIPVILDPGSFRDPAGCVFSNDGKIYRSIFTSGAKEYEAARDAGIYDKLITAGLLLPHKELDIYDFAPEGTVYCLNHPTLPMISYPWEWPFSMLQDAALIHLDAMELLIPEGFWLRDANTFNVQYDGNRLRLIDTLSVGKREPDSPWVGYKQFCSHFLAPLAIAAYCDIRTLSFWRNYIDGFPLDLAAKMLPLFRRYQPRLFMHLTLHARFQESADRWEDVGNLKPQKKSKVTDLGLIGLVRSLRKCIKGIKSRHNSKLWDKYKAIRTYQSEDVTRKSEYVNKVVEQVKPEIVWDLGANTGELSMIAASHGAFVVSIEGDPVCTEYLYHRLSEEDKTRRILPLTMDIANPSPGLGWNNRERPSLNDRSPADLVLALALIHHLVFSSNIPLSLIAEWFSRITDHLLVEFVPSTDPMVQKLMVNRRDEHLPYSLELFQSSFGKYFGFLDQVKLENGRILFLARCK